MDYEKNIAIDEFLRKRKQEKNHIFNVKVDINQLGFSPIISGFSVSFDIAKDDYVLTFWNDLVRTYIGGYVQMDAHFLTNVRFDGYHLCFSVGNVDVTLE